MASSPVAIRGLSCGYGDRKVLRRLDWELPQDRTVCLLGPGGAGKSTLLRLLADRVPQNDEFWLEGELVHRCRDSMDYLGQKLVEEARSLLDLLHERGHKGTEAESMALDVWSDVPAARELLVATLDLPLRRLPVQLARLAAVTAVVADLPALVLLDEPDAEMDDEFRAWLQRALRRLRGRCTVVFTTHHLRLARQASDDCLLLDSGRLVEHGPTEALFQRPRNERTRRFVEMGN